jgi:hypothetical protein
MSGSSLQRRRHPTNSYQDCNCGCRCSCISIRQSHEARYGDEGQRGRGQATCSPARRLICLPSMADCESPLSIPKFESIHHSPTRTRGGAGVVGAHAAPTPPGHAPANRHRPRGAPLPRRLRTERPIGLGPPARPFGAQHTQHAAPVCLTTRRVGGRDKHGGNARNAHGY